MLDQSVGMAGESPERLKDVIAGARSVVLAVSAPPTKNHKLPKNSSAAGRRGSTETG